MPLSEEQKAFLDQQYDDYVRKTGDRPPKKMCTTVGRMYNPPILPAIVGR
jgi:hypothetical protein